MPFPAILTATPKIEAATLARWEWVTDKGGADLGDDFVDDDDDKAELRERFFKERRMLLGVSLVLLAHQFLGISVGKETAALGFHIEIEDPDRIWWVLWGIWGWTVICYLQQFNSLRLYSEFPRERATEKRDQLANRLVTARVRGVAMGHLRSVIPKKDRRLGVRFERVEPAVSSGGKVRKDMFNAFVIVHAQWAGNDQRFLQEKISSIDGLITKAGWSCSGGSQLIAEGIVSFDRVISLDVHKIRQGRWIRARASLWVALSTSFLTDYIVPLVFGVLPLLVVAWKLIKGVL